MGNSLVIEGEVGVFYRVNPEGLKRTLAKIKIQEDICETSCDKSESCPHGYICDDIKRRVLEIDNG